MTLNFINYLNTTIFLPNFTYLKKYYMGQEQY
jgi:hypothetical protein